MASKASYEHTLNGGRGRGDSAISAPQPAGAGGGAGGGGGGGGPPAEPGAGPDTPGTPGAAQGVLGNKNVNKLFGVSPSDIDKYSRVVFPVCFVCFNLMYWVIYMHISNIVAEDLVYVGN